MVVSVGDENELVLLDVKTLLGETKAKQKANLMGKVQFSSSEAVPLEKFVLLKHEIKAKTCEVVRIFINLFACSSLFLFDLTYYV